jgi:hypothetical protein
MADRDRTSRASPHEKFADWLADAVGSVVRDVRQRVVERGWFGEAVTPRSQNITIGSAGKQSPTEQEWFARFFGSEGREAGQAGRAQQHHEQDRGIER